MAPNQTLLWFTLWNWSYPLPLILKAWCLLIGSIKLHGNLFAIHKPHKMCACMDRLPCTIPLPAAIKSSQLSTVTLKLRDGWIYSGRGNNGAVQTFYSNSYKTNPRTLQFSLLLILVFCSTSCWLFYRNIWIYERQSKKKYILSIEKLFCAHLKTEHCGYVLYDLAAVQLLKALGIYCTMHCKPRIFLPLPAVTDQTSEDSHLLPFWQVK